MWQGILANNIQEKIKKSEEIKKNWKKTES